MTHPNRHGSVPVAGVAAAALGAALAKLRGPSGGALLVVAGLAAWCVAPLAAAASVYRRRDF